MENIVKIENLIKKYNNSENFAVNNVSFDVNQGELFSLLGVNGAGKSTIINILCTLLQKTEGNIWINNYELGKNDNDIRNSIGIVFQGSVLDKKLTVEENLKLRMGFYSSNKNENLKRIKELCERLSMGDFLKSEYGRLSGGQRRKCDVARALLVRPKLLFLDEPTTGLDPRSRIDLWKIINDVIKEDKMTVFLTTHYMEETEDANRVAIIDKGKILCIDTPQKLKSKYSNDIVKLILKDKTKNIDNILKTANFDFTFMEDTYSINMKNGLDIIDILPNIKNYLDSFELKKGNMDSVFLNVVGRKFENE